MEGCSGFLEEKAQQPTDHLVAADLYLGIVALGLLKKRATQPTDHVVSADVYLAKVSLGLLKGPPTN